MRKLLLLFITLITGISSAIAQSELIYTLTPKAGSNQSYANNCDITIDGITWNLTGNSTMDPWRIGGKNITNTDRTLYSKTAMSRSVDKVIVSFGSVSSITVNSSKLLVADNADFANAIETTFTVKANSDVEIAVEAAAGSFFKFVFNVSVSGSSNKYIQFKKAVFYGTAEAGAVVAPTIVLGEENMVTISQEDGADIYYTTNGEVPTTSSTQYTAPFEITDVTTVKAIAVLDGVESAVTSKEVKPNTVTSISKFIELANTIDDTKINTPLTAIYQCGRNLYLTDGTDYILAYNGNNAAAVTNLTAVNGDVISYITGAYKSQAGLPEIIPSAVGEKSAGTAVEPAEYAIEEISTEMLNHYVKITSIDIVAASNANNYTATDETGSIIIYNTFNNASNYPEAITQPDGTKSNTVPEGEGFTVYGFVSIYNNTVQITPIKFEGGTVMENVATPTFTPASGSELSIGDEITIECATEGAKIYYTTNGDTPTTSSTEYTAPIEFTEACTIKAIAVADGYLDSEVATATYTLYVEGASKATFDFTATGNVGSLANTTITAPSSSATATDINDVSFTNGPVTITTLTANHSKETSPKWFYYSSKGVSECRMYNGNQLDVVVEDGYKIAKIEFTQNAGSTDWKDMTVTTTPENGGTWTNESKTWDASENANVKALSFVPTGTNRFATMVITYVADENNEPEGVKYNGTLNIKLDAIGLDVNQEDNVYIKDNGNGTCLFTLPNFTLTLPGSDPANFGDIVVDNVTMTTNADNSITYAGSVQGMELAGGEIVADVEISGTEVDGVLEMNIPVSWEDLLIDVTFNGQKDDSTGGDNGNDNTEIDYCTPTGVDGRYNTENQTTYDGRYVSSIEVSDGTSNVTVEGSSTATTRAIVYDRTSTIFSTEAGKTISMNVDGSGSWMNTFVYVDWNLDGFTYSDQVYENYTLKNQTSVGNDIKTSFTFTVPATQAPGEYRVRYIVDWQNTDPCKYGQAKTYQSNNDNGEVVIDFIIKVDSTAGIGDIEIDNSNAPVEYYNLQGVRIAAENLVPGFYIIRQGDKAAKVFINK